MRRRIWTLNAGRALGELARSRSSRIGPGGRRETYATEVTTHTNATHAQPRTGTRSTQPLLALALNVKTACYRPNGQRGFVRAGQKSMRPNLPLKKRICRHDGRCQKFGRPRFFDDTFMSVASLLLSIGFQNGPPSARDARLQAWRCVVTTCADWRSGDRRNRDELTIPIPGIPLSQSIIQPAQWLSL